MPVKRHIVLAAALALAGCASTTPGNLVPGQSTAAQAEARWGAPDQRIALPGGDTALYFSRQPYGRAMYVVAVGPDNVVKSVEQRLSRENAAKIVPGTWTKKEVLALLGPPGDTGRTGLGRREWWEYRYDDYEKRVIWVMYSDEGVVREVIDRIDPEDEKNRDANDNKP